MSTLVNSLMMPAPIRPARAEVGSTNVRRARAPRADMGADEILVADARAGITPSEMVERKLFTLLHGRPLPAQAVPPAAHRYVRRA